jgi:hypothetical protein
LSGHAAARSWPKFSLLTTKHSPSRMYITGVVRLRPLRRPVVVRRITGATPAVEASRPRVRR